MKAIVLLSGGLDSTLVARIIKNEGIEAIALNFKTPFCLCDGKASSGCFSHSRKVAQDLGVEFRVMNVAEDFFRIVENPRHGYGSNMNPCIDCRILKFSKAKAFMQEAGASFIVTGEVVGQRPMSQHKATLAIIDKESGLEGLVLRPLSAQLLPETIPEKEGWISRQKMLGFSGRGRRPQMELAKAFHIKDYPCPAGGCLLTDPAFSKRIRDLMQYDKLSLNNVELLKVGRHFRLSPKARLVVGRNELENARLDALKEPKDHLFMPKETAGPTALGRGQFSEELICFSCGIVSHYCDGHSGRAVDIVYNNGAAEERVLATFALAEDKIAVLRI